MNIAMHSAQVMELRDRSPKYSPLARALHEIHFPPAWRKSDREKNVHVKMENKRSMFPRILLRTPTADGELQKVVTGSSSDPELNQKIYNAEDIFESEFESQLGHLSPTSDVVFSISSSPSLSSHEPTPTPARSPTTHQRSISLVDPCATPMVPIVDTKEDSRRPRGMSLPFGPTVLQDQPTSSRRRGMSFLHLNEGGFSSLYHQLQHLPVPTLTISTPAGELGGRKFSFGLRRLSQTTLNRSDSMISLSFRSLTTFVSEDNLPALRNYLELKKNQVDDRDENNATALMFAAEHGKLPFVRELIRYGADVNAEDADNWSALLCATREGHLAICRELLEHGANVDHRDMGSFTALLWAAYKERTDIVSLLLEKKADANAHDNHHLSALHWACGRGHVEVVKLLISHGGKVNVGDKYGTTPLTWACRKGNLEIVEILMKAGAHVDASGMNSWTPLLIATAGNHVEVVNLLLEHKPNVNALDKDGYTALATACKEGFNDIAQALLLAPGIYVSQQHRSGDTNLILAVKGGHRGIVEALIKKYVDIDTAGKDKKTALYTAVEKNNPGIVKILLGSNPDLEVTTKDGDTALLRAVRNRNAEIVQLLVDKKAKVSATDKKGDTALHIAMRARSKTIVEILLRNPKNSQMLYRPNRNGETPYNIDVNHQKTILSQVFGHLITNEENENMLGYDLYSSALADILSEPTLSMPITVGLYAKWGSGKSFLLRKLKEEMKNFSRKWVDPSLRISLLLVAVVLHVAAPLGVTLAVVTSWLTGLILAGCVVVLAFTFLLILWACNKRYDWNWPYQASVNLAKTMNSFRLVLKVMFCNPPGSQMDLETTRTQPIQFFFTDQARISNTTSGEHHVCVLLGSLYDSIEAEYGWLSTRLYRAFRPTAQKPTSSWRWRKACCMPFVVIFELWLLLSMVEIVFLSMYFQAPSILSTPNSNATKPDSESQRSLHLAAETLQMLLIVLGTVLAVGILANINTFGHLATSLVFSQRRHLQRTIARLESLQSEGFLSALKKEVSLMIDMVKCLDAMTGQQSRLVVVVDGLDSCDQDKVLMVLDTIHLLTDVNSPFIVVLAIDPHVIAEAVKRNTRRLISESNINGLEYLKNMVHLPFFLANSALRRVKVAQTASRRSTLAANDDEASVPQLQVRRISMDSSFAASTEKLKPPTRKGSRKLKMSESIASSIGSNLNKICGAQDLTKMLLTDDYFSDVNPRSMRRLLNVIYVTGRLLKAFQMEFNWYRLALWANITEQWPYRCSWIIYHYETNEDRWDDQTPLKLIYDEIRQKIPASKEVEPLMEVDRDEKKFEVFLSYHRSTLMLADVKVFLPFAINLDPYFKKVIREDLQEEDWDNGMTFQPRSSVPKSPWGPAKTPETALQRRAKRFSAPTPSAPPVTMWTDQGWVQFTPQPPPPVPSFQTHQPISATSTIPNDLLESKLSSRTVAEVCELILRTNEIDTESAVKYTALIKSNNITGKVLLHCDLNELKNVLQMAFGDWELFKLLVVSLREHELTLVTQTDEGQKNVRFSERRRTSEKKRSEVDKETRRGNAQTAVENQVTLEDEMICGALTTLSEEACEDVIDGGCVDIDTKDTSVVYIQSSPLSQTTWQVADDSSAPSSVAGTPILRRRSIRRNSRSRPSSLIVEQTSPLTSRSNHTVKSLKIIEPPAVIPPNLIITPASSLEKLQRIKDKLKRTSGEAILSAANSLSDDESVPLVSQANADTPSCDVSPMSGQQTAGGLNNIHTSSSETSVFLGRCKSCESIASGRSKLSSHDVDCVHDMTILHVRSRHVTSPPLLRQHEVHHDNQDSSLAMEWDGPETSV